MFLYHFDVLISKYFFIVFLSKKHFKKQLLHRSELPETMSSFIRILHFLE